MKKPKKRQPYKPGDWKKHYEAHSETERIIKYRKLYPVAPVYQDVVSEEFQYETRIQPLV